MYTAAFKEVRDWLSEYKMLKSEELHTYAQMIRNRHQLVDALITLFEDGLGGEYVEPVCHQLYNFFKSGDVELRRFALDLVPVMVWVYLSAVSRGEKRKCSGLEACLLGIYNLEIVEEDGTPKVTKYTIPTLAVPSIYHEPPSLATLALTESALMRYHSEEPSTITSPPSPPHETVNAQNRLQIVTYVISVYNADIFNMSEKSHKYFCKLCTKVCQTGFDHLEDIQTGLVAVNLNDSISSASSRGSKRSVTFAKDQPRIPLSAEFLVELLSGLYFVMFNGQARPGIDALERVHMRASYELYAEVLLVTNAIRNSLQANPSGQPQDGPMGISIALSPAQRDEAFSKHAITNASFRAKKLPEDIDIVPGDEGDWPPHYDDVVETDRATGASAEKTRSKLPSNMLRSIMKKTSDREHKKISRKESDSKRKSDVISESNSPKSPKHSLSTYSDIADPMQVQVALATARNSVDKVEMSSLPSQSSLPSHASSKSSHKRSTSYEESRYPEVENSDESEIKNTLNGSDHYPVVIRSDSNRLLEKLNRSSVDASNNSSSSSLNTAM